MNQVSRAGGREDEGSILPLTLGYALLAIALICVCVCATDLHLAQKRLDALADAAALAGADGFTLVVEGTQARAILQDEAIGEQAAAVVQLMQEQAPERQFALVSAGSPDGSSARVTVTALWRPPLFTPLVPDGIELVSTATSRTILR